MNVEALRKEAIRRVENTEDEAALQKVLDLLNAHLERPSIERIYDELKEQYGNTLQKLAQ